MAESSIRVTIQKLVQTSDVGNSTHIAWVRPALGVGNTVGVNRRFHETNGGNVHDVVVVTIYADTAEDMERLGEQVHACLKDDPDGNEWNCGEAMDVQFEATGSDITGWDVERNQYLRSIEFEVSW